MSDLQDGCYTVNDSTIRCNRPSDTCSDTADGHGNTGGNKHAKSELLVQYSYLAALQIQRNSSQAFI